MDLIATPIGFDADAYGVVVAHELDLAEVSKTVQFRQTVRKV